MSILRFVYMLLSTFVRTLFPHDIYFEVCLHVVNFISIHDVYFWGLFTCYELCFYAIVYFKVCLHVVNFLSIHDVYFEVCLHAANFVPTRCLFWGLFTCCELCSYTMSILANKPVNVSGKYFFMRNRVWQCDPYMSTLFMSSLLFISCNFVFDCIWLYYNCPPFSLAIFITRFRIVFTLFIYNHGKCNYI